MATASASSKRLKAEDLVKEARLKAIEYEHRSMGSILDTRTIDRIEEPRIAEQILTRIEVNKAFARKKYLLPSLDSSSTARATQPDNIESAANNVNLTGDDFMVEEQIFYARIKEPSYLHQKRFKGPGLARFKEKMSPEEKREFNRRYQEEMITILRKIAMRYRNEMIQQKKDMDSAGVFHPDANAQRVHCMYLMKLYKAIKFETIELPVIKKMAKLETGENLDNLDASTSVADGTVDDEVMSSRSRKTANSESKSKRSMQTSKSTHTLGNSRNRSVSSPTQRKLRDSASVPSLDKKSLKSGKTARQGNAKDKNGASSQGSNAKGGGVSVSSNPNEAAPQANEKDRNNYLKLQKGKLGKIDPRKILRDEASRLQRSEVVEVQKAREEGTLFDEKIFSWMVESLQSSQIERATEGNNLPTEGMNELDEDSYSLVNESNDEDPFMHGEYLKAKKKMNGKVVPFNDFYNLFETKAKSGDMLANKNILDALQQLKESHHELESAAKLKDMASFKSSKETKDMPFLNSRMKGQSQHYRDESLRSVNAASLRHIRDPSFESDNGDQKKTINIVQLLGRKDPEFEQYLKQKNRAQPMSEILAKSSAKKGYKKRVRSVAPLGYAAVDEDQLAAIVKAQTRRKKHTQISLGFTNHFANEEDMDASDADGDGHATKQSARADSAGGVSDVLDVQAAEDAEVKSAIEEKAEDRDRQASDHTGRVTFSEGGRGVGTGGRVTSRGSMLSGRTSGRSSSRSPRRRLRTSSGGGEVDIQDKLLQVWDVLQIPSEGRLLFMQKYSEAAYSLEFARATDMWGEAAVLVLGRLVVARMIEKLKGGFCVFPVSVNDLLDMFESRIPALLKSESAVFVPRSVEALVSGADGSPVEAIQRSMSGTMSSRLDRRNSGRLDFDGSVVVNGRIEEDKFAMGASGSGSGILRSDSEYDDNDSVSSRRSKGKAKRDSETRARARARIALQHNPTALQTLPLSVTGADAVRAAMQRSFALAAGVASNPEQCATFFRGLGKEIDELLNESLKYTFEQLGDTVRYVNKDCKDWVAANPLQI